MIEIYTDGGYNWTTTIGGWAYLIKESSSRREAFGAELGTTNNKMELLAAIMALESFEDSIIATVYSDSTYVINGITNWIHGWKKKGWNKIKNRELWERLDSANQRHNLSWIWVKAHNGHVDNTYVDKLAGEAIKRLTLPTNIAKI